MTENQRYGIALAGSLVFAYLGSKAPSYRMPIDYAAIISRSIPFAIAWAVIFVFCLWRYKKRGLWLLVGAPFALYWQSGCYSIISRIATTWATAFELK
jgi:FtsH-binding integral membrane protein